jgi:hypothetical protein
MMKAQDIVEYGFDASPYYGDLDKVVSRNDLDAFAWAVLNAYTAAMAGQPQEPPHPITQHLAWLKQYVEGMDESNWKDMRLRAERQLEQISADLDVRFATDTRPDRNTQQEN